MTFRKALGIVFIVLAIISMVVWEKWGKSQLLYDEIPVLSINVERGTVIKDSMIKFVRLNCSEECIKKQGYKDIVGKEANSFIHKGVPLFKEYFVSRERAVNSEKNLFAIAIPEKLIINKWGNSKNNDKAYIFSGNKEITKCSISNIDSEAGIIELISSKEGIKAISGAIAEGNHLVIARG